MHIRKEVQAKRHDYAEQHDARRKYVQHKPMPADGIHEPRTDLHTDGIHEKNKSELLDKMKHVMFNAQAQVSEDDSYKERPRTAKANALDLDFAYHEADSRRESNDDHLLPYRGLEE